MALTFSDVNTNNSTTSTATLTVGSVTANIGDWLVVMVAADNNGTNGVASLSNTVTDDAGNTYNLEFKLNRTGGTAADGITLGVWTSQVTKVTSAATITTNYSPNTTAKAVAVKKIVTARGKIPTIIAEGAGTTGSATSGTTTVSVTSGDTILGVTAVEQSTIGTVDSDTSNGSWSTAQTASGDTGSNTGSATISSQQKTVSATGNQTYNITFGGNSRDYAINYLIFREIDAEYWALNGITG